MLMHFCIPSQVDYFRAWMSRCTRCRFTEGPSSRKHSSTTSLRTRPNCEWGSEDIHERSNENLFRSKAQKPLILGDIIRWEYPDGVNKRGEITTFMREQNCYTTTCKHGQFEVGEFWRENMSYSARNTDKNIPNKLIRWFLSFEWKPEKLKYKAYFR